MMFSIGDTVMLSSKREHSAKNGALALVIDNRGLLGREPYIKIKWDRETNSLANHQMDGDYFERDFQLYATAHLKSLSERAEEYDEIISAQELMEKING